MKATADVDKPIPGYLYKEISNISHESGDNCESLLDFLVDRLNSDSTHVKLKVLKVMKYVVENGHPNFRLGLLKKSNGIKDATKYSGPPDPIHGNVPYTMVRKTAQSLTETLFNMDKGAQDVLSLSPQKTISTVGIGSSHDRDSVRPKMEGFGNITSTPQNKSFGENIKDGLFKMVEKLGDNTKDQQRELLSTLDGSSNYRPPTNSSFGGVQSSSTAPIRNPDPPKHTSPPKHIPGRAGGGWDDSDDDAEDTGQHLSKSTGSGHLSKSTGSGHLSKSAGSGSLELCERLENTTLEDFTVEQTLISSYVDNTESMLLKRSQLTAFVKDCNSLNCDKIVEFLNAKIASSSSSAHGVMKSLMLLEALMMSDLVNLERLAGVCKDGMAAVYHGQTGPPKSKARKLIRILEKLTSHQSILPVSDGNLEIVP